MEFFILNRYFDRCAYFDFDHSSGCAFFWWLYILGRQMNASEQNEHLCIFWPVCVPVWSFRAWIDLNVFEQKSHLCIRSQWTSKMWRELANLFGDILPQWEHVSGFNLCLKICGLEKFQFKILNIHYIENIIQIYMRIQWMSCTQQCFTNFTL